MMHCRQGVAAIISLCFVLLIALDSCCIVAGTWSSGGRNDENTKHVRQHHPSHRKKPPPNRRLRKGTLYKNGVGVDAREWEGGNGESATVANKANNNKQGRGGSALNAARYAEPAINTQAVDTPYIVETPISGAELDQNNPDMTWGTQWVRDAEPADQIDDNGARTAPAKKVMFWGQNRNADVEKRHFGPHHAGTGPYRGERATDRKGRGRRSRGSDMGKRKGQGRGKMDSGGGGNDDYYVVDGGGYDEYADGGGGGGGGGGGRKRMVMSSSGSSSDKRKTDSGGTKDGRGYEKRKSGSNSGKRKSGSGGGMRRKGGSRQLGDRYSQARREQKGGGVVFKNKDGNNGRDELVSDEEQEYELPAAPNAVEQASASTEENDNAYISSNTMMQENSDPGHQLPASPNAVEQASVSIEEIDNAYISSNTIPELDQPAPKGSFDNADGVTSSNAKLEQQQQQHPSPNAVEQGTTEEFENTEDIALSSNTKWEEDFLAQPEGNVWNQENDEPINWNKRLGGKQAKTAAEAYREANNVGRAKNEKEPNVDGEIEKQEKKGREEKAGKQVEEQIPDDGAGKGRPGEEPLNSEAEAQAGSPGGNKGEVGAAVGNPYPGEAYYEHQDELAAQEHAGEDFGILAPDEKTGEAPDEPQSSSADIDANAVAHALPLAGYDLPSSNPTTDSPSNSPSTWQAARTFNPTENIPTSSAPSSAPSGSPSQTLSPSLSPSQPSQSGEDSTTNLGGVTVVGWDSNNNGNNSGNEVGKDDSNTVDNAVPEDEAGEDINLLGGVTVVGWGSIAGDGVGIDSGSTTTETPTSASPTTEAPTSASPSTANPTTPTPSTTSPSSFAPTGVQNGGDSSGINKSLRVKDDPTELSRDHVKDDFAGNEQTDDFWWDGEEQNAAIASIPTQNPGAPPNSTEDRSDCRICSSGNKPLNPNRVIMHTKQTCQELAEELDLAPVASCTAKKTILPIDVEAYCGCEGVTMTSWCTFCPQGTSNIYRDVTIPSLNMMSCGDVELHSSFITVPGVCESLGHLSSLCCGTLDTYWRPPLEQETEIERDWGSGDG